MGTGLRLAPSDALNAQGHSGVCNGMYWSYWCCRRACWGCCPPFQPLAHTPGTKTHGDPVRLPPELEGERAQREEEEEEEG